MPDIELPRMTFTTAGSDFRLRVHAAAWHYSYGRSRRGRRQRGNLDGLLLLSATGPDTAIKAIRATLLCPEVEATIRLFRPEANVEMAKAVFNQKPVGYEVRVARLTKGAVHLVAVAKVPGLMPNDSDDHLWAELTGTRYTTPLLRCWVPTIRQQLLRQNMLVKADGHNAVVSILRVEPDQLDKIIVAGVHKRKLELVA